MAYFKILPIQKDKYTDMGMINVDAQLFLEPGDKGYEKYITEHYVQVPVIPESGYPNQEKLEAALEEDSAYKEQQKLISTFPEEIKIVDGEEIIIPIYPEGFVKLPIPVLNFQKEIEDYNNWIKSLPTVRQLNPFCTHSIQFECDVTEEEILWCFEFALGITHRNYLMDDLRCEKGGQIVNQNIHYSARRAFYKGIGTIPEHLQSDYMKSEMTKVGKVSARLSKIKDVDFTKIKTIGKYSVRK